MLEKCYDGNCTGRKNEKLEVFSVITKCFVS